MLGSRLLQTSIRAPDVNAYIERFIRSISEDCLDHIVFLSEEHLFECVVGYRLSIGRLIFTDQASLRGFETIRVSGQR